MRFWGLIACLVGTLLVWGCGQRINNQVPTESPSPSAQPSPTPLPPDVGNGQDGDIIIDDERAINTCTVLTSASGTTAEVASATGFDPDRRVLLYQVQDDFTASYPPSGDPAPLDAPGSAGQWEIARVQAVNGTTLTFSGSLKNTYSTAGTVKAQACTVLEYDSVTVSLTGLLRAAEWNGDTGGVVAFYAADVLRVQGTISASEAGFRGGQLLGQNNCVDELNYDVINGRGGGKGEGLDGRSYGLEGRGVLGNAAGGGNCHNAGGGGGGNGGAGGQGGQQAASEGNEPLTAGLGGGALTASMGERLAFGGGGGAGQHNDALTGTAGADGGGLIWIVANDLTGGGVIESSGGSALTSGDDGAGGGGAGGTIWIQAVTSDFSGSVVATGGAGGMVGAGTTHGPGGGGGGGRVGLTASVGVTPNTAGGLNGTNQNLDPHDAAPGTNGSPDVLPDL